ncbi:MAG: NAD(P)/FAD-dependent oxidoreductase [Thermodesulfovibrio sp.]|nr:NAD(P)/FAD-dependent oxidoreductase [Thermodesulfovibrio sp.]
MEEIRVTIIGAGIVGLAIASKLSERYDNIVVLEQHDTFGQETSSRNSEVIHSGIYYPENSLKARLCVEGAENLYEICKKYSIPHRKLGKLIVATDYSELKVLQGLLEKGIRNNVKDLVILDKHEIDKIEPNTNALLAVYSPNTGIIDSHSLMKHFFNTAKGREVLFAFQSEVESLGKDRDGFIVGIKKDNYKFRSKIVINCAGLSSDYVAGLAGIDIDKSGYKIKFCKGSYFSYAKASPVNMLIYPTPYEKLEGLGVHATLDLGSRLRFGPDVEYVEFIDYKVDSSKRDIFYESASKIIPGLDKEAFIPDMAGIRPKLQGPDEQTKDFIIKEESDNGLSGLINLIGIESPGLTASPAIAGMVADIVSKL